MALDRLLTNIRRGFTDRSGYSEGKFAIAVRLKLSVGKSHAQG